ncbi:MAG: 3-deoxy-D-manno-octulosonic acid transferase [Chloroflexota bacterium]
MNSLYNYLILPALSFIISLAKLFNPKLREREGIVKQQLKASNLNIRRNAPTIWFHAASMGEFEQAKPVIELIKKSNAKVNIVCSFFSPSGYDTQKNYAFADETLYLPFDLKKNVIKFLDLVKPDLAVFIRYDIWRNYLSELHNREIPAYLINATAPRSKALRSFIGLKSFTRGNYALFKKIFAMSEGDYSYFKSLSLPDKVIQSSDSRFDRIIEKVEEAKNAPIAPKELINSGKKIFLLGSSWPPDEELAIRALFKINPALSDSLQLIIVPHEPTPDCIARLRGSFKESVLLSEILGGINNGAVETLKKQAMDKTIIVDSIGHLLKLYSLADVAHVGGAFGAGVHSVTEPAGYGIPLSCGPKYKNSPDAVRLVGEGALTPVETPEDMAKLLTLLLENPGVRKERGARAAAYVYSGKGASAAIVENIFDELSSFRLDKSLK